MKKIKYLGVSLIIILFLVIFISLPAGKVSATTYLSNLSDTMSTVAPSVVASHAIIFKSTSGITASQTITIAFSSGWVTTGLTVGDITMAYGTTSACGSSLTMSGATGFTPTNSSPTITLTAGASLSSIPAGDFICINISSATTAITNPSAGSYTITLTTTNDAATTITVVIVANSVVVSGTVNQSMTFSLTGNSAALGQITTGTAIQNCADYFDFATNASGGGSVTYTGVTLTAANGTDTFAGTGECATGCTSNTAHTQFAFNLMHNTAPTTCGTAAAATTSGTPIGTVATGYNTGGTYQFHTGDTIASCSAPIVSTRYYIAFLANISPTQPAGNYSTNLTFTASATY